MLHLKHSYFSIPSLFDWLRRQFNPYTHRKDIQLSNNTLTVEWTRRAENALSERAGPLYVDMQLYFSCVVQKRVLFHDSTEHDVITVDNRLSVMFRPVEAQSCDPQSFADNHPVKRELFSRSATRMRPRLLQIDYSDREWSGRFSI